MTTGWCRSCGYAFIEAADSPPPNRPDLITCARCGHNDDRVVHDPSFAGCAKPLRLDLRLSPAEQAAYEQAAGALGVARWARAVLAQAAGVTAIPRGRGADVKPRKKRGPRPDALWKRAASKACAYCGAVVDVERIQHEDYAVVQCRDRASCEERRPPPILL